MIKLQKISKSFFVDGESVVVATVEDLTLEKGKSYFLKGESGRGKTTLCNMLSGLLLPDENPGAAVLYDDVDITKLTEMERDSFRAKQVGYLFQDFNLFDGFSSLENVLIPLLLVEKGNKAECKKKALEMLSAVGVEHRANVNVTKLSGGEKQRVALARAVINDPALIIADEPTGNLDKVNGERVMQMIFERVRATGATLLVVSHDLSYTPLFDYVLDIEELGGVK